MPDPLQPLRFLLVLFAGWIRREQAQVVDYLVEENRVLREQLGDKRLRLTDDQRRRLAAKGKVRASPRNDFAPGLVAQGRVRT